VTVAAPRPAPLPAALPAPPAAPARRVPAPVWWATAALGLLLALWSVAVPAYRAVDEPQHLSTVLRFAERGSYPPPGKAVLEPQVAASYPLFDFPGGDDRTFVPPRAVSASPPPDWPSFSDLRSAPVPAEQVGQADQMTQHPPLWTLLAAAEVRVAHLADVPADAAMLALRLLQGLLLLPLPWLVWVTGRLLGASPTGAAAASWLPLGVPQLLHIGASITDGDLLLLLVASTLPLLVLAARGDRRLRVAAGLGGLVGAVLLTKSFGLLLPPCVLLAYALGARAGGARFPWRPAVLATVLPVLLAGWWYALRYAHTGSLQPSGYPAAVQARLEQDYSAQSAVGVFTGSLLKTSWQDLGWLETPSRLSVVVPIWVAVSAAVGVAIARRWVVRSAATVVLAPFLLLLAAVCLREVQTFSELHAVYGAQGRYLFPGFVGVCAVLAVALSRAPDRLRRAVPLACLLPQALGLHLAVAYFWADGTAGALAYSPLPAAAVVALAAGAACCALAAVVHRGAARGTPLVIPAPGGARVGAAR